MKNINEIKVDDIVYVLDKTEITYTREKVLEVKFGEYGDIHIKPFMYGWFEEEYECCVSRLDSRWVLFSDKEWMLKYIENWKDKIRDDAKKIVSLCSNLKDNKEYEYRYIRVKYHITGTDRCEYFYVSRYEENENKISICGSHFSSYGDTLVCKENDRKEYSKKLKDLTIDLISEDDMKRELLQVYDTIEKKLKIKNNEEK